MSVYRRPDPIPRPRTDQPSVASPLQPVRTESDDLHHLVARKIFAAIAAGHFAEGSILPNEHALGETLGVSRTALREAIKGLSSKGMLETRRRRGTLVTDRSQWTMVDGEVITWSRKSDAGKISEELWQGLQLVLPTIAASAASSRGHARFQPALPEGKVGRARIAVIASLLTSMARLSENRFLFSLASISLLNLLQDDPQFLEQVFAPVPDSGFVALRDAIVEGHAEQASAAMTALFVQDLAVDDKARVALADAALIDG